MAVSERLRREVVTRANHLCEYCRCHASFCPYPFSVEHIHPESLGGQTVLANLAYSCQGCNNAKYNFIEAVDPLTDQLVLLYNPRTDLWPTHFLWSEDGLELIGITPTGRATIERLRLNRENVVGWRRMAIAFGIHPPSPIELPSL
ncbi:HNH endonuclease [Armatimonas sp.]|uniref:HNH endonuclease n=1 Tax=Armatimonas sp. TaxID=1872638 RepID=UPI00374FECF3